MTIHPFIRPGQRPDQRRGDEWQAGSEQWFVDEADRSRPSPVWAGVFALVLLALLFVVGSFVAWVL